MRIDFRSCVAEVLLAYRSSLGTEEATVIKAVSSGGGLAWLSALTYLFEL